MSKKQKNQVSVSVHYPDPKTAAVKHEVKQTDMNFFGCGKFADWME